MNTSRLLLISALLRALLTAWGYVQDHYMSVKYTDIDYSVFTDAARYVVRGQSPFLRSTYRYSPLLAYIMVPNVLWTEIFGKVSVCTLEAELRACLCDYIL
jgi:phosphatidylinositol glycan class M